MRCIRCHNEILREPYTDTIQSLGGSWRGVYGGSIICRIERNGTYYFHAPYQISDIIRDLTTVVME